MFWKVQGFYDREKINELIDEFEQFYDSFFDHLKTDKCEKRQI